MPKTIRQDLHSAVKNKKALMYHSCHKVNEENPACLEQKKPQPKQNKPKQRNIPFWDTGIQSVILKIFSKVTSKCWESNFELWICEVIWWKLNIFLQNNIGKHSCWLSAVLKWMNSNRELSSHHWNQASHLWPYRPLWCSWQDVNYFLTIMSTGFSREVSKSHTGT